MKLQYSKPEVKLDDKDMKKIQKIINSGWFCGGEYVTELENHFKEKFMVKNAVACSSCTSGLIIAVKALGIKKGVVLLPAFTWPSTLYAIECNGNTPLWCDINEDSWDINPELAENGWWDAQISVDIFGNESYIPIKRQSRNIKTIYDAAHGYGLNNLGKRGDFEVVSLSFTKPVTGMQGGVILSDKDDSWDEVVELVKLSAKLTDVNAYIALKSIEQFEEIQNLKSDIRKEYRRLIEVPYIEQEIPLRSVYSTFSILFNSQKKRDAVANKFEENGIEVKIYYEPLCSGFKNTDKVYRRIISLPMYKEMIPEIPKICEIINNA